MKLKSICRAPLLLTLAAGAPAAAAQQPVDLFQAFQGTNASLNKLSGQISNYAALPCLTDDSRGHLERYQGSTEAIAEAVRKNYQSYVVVLKKPMSGNGKCDGGFNAVASEVAARRKSTEDLEARVRKLQGQLLQEMSGHFLGVEMNMPDESEEARCSANGLVLHDALADQGLLSWGGMEMLSSRIAVQKEALLAYESRNSKLGNDCGSLVVSHTIPGSLAGGFSQMIPSGKSAKHENTITGRALPDQLSGPGRTAPQKDSGRLADPGHAHASNSTDGDPGAEVQARARGRMPAAITAAPSADRATAGKSEITGSGFGPLSGEDGAPADFRDRSEELAVQALGSPGQAPGPAAGPGAGSAVLLGLQQLRSTPVPGAEGSIAEPTESSGASAAAQRTLFERIHLAIQKQNWETGGRAR